MSPSPNYHSYLLRVWRDGIDHPWRASLHSVASGEKVTFADIRTLFAFLNEQFAAEQKCDEGDESISPRSVESLFPTLQQG